MWPFDSWDWPKRTFYALFFVSLRFITRTFAYCYSSLCISSSDRLKILHLNHYKVVPYDDIQIIKHSAGVHASFL